MMTSAMTPRPMLRRTLQHLAPGSALGGAGPGAGAAAGAGGIPEDVAVPAMHPRGLD